MLSRGVGNAVVEMPRRRQQRGWMHQYPMQTQHGKNRLQEGMGIQVMVTPHGSPYLSWRSLWQPSQQPPPPPAPWPSMRWYMQDVVVGENVQGRSCLCG